MKYKQCTSQCSLKNIKEGKTSLSRIEQIHQKAESPRPSLKQGVLAVGDARSTPELLRKHKLCVLVGAVQVLELVRCAVEGQERVPAPTNSVANSRTLVEQPELPEVVSARAHCCISKTLILVVCTFSQFYT